MEHNKNPLDRNGCGENFQEPESGETLNHPEVPELYNLASGAVTDVIDRIMIEKDISAAEVIRRAIAVYDFVLTETRSGKAIVIMDPDGHGTEIWPL